MQHERVDEFIEQAQWRDILLWVIRIPNRAVDDVSRPQTPVLRSVSIERAIPDGSYRLRRRRWLQFELAGRRGASVHSTYLDCSIAGVSLEDIFVPLSLRA